MIIIGHLLRGVMVRFEHLQRRLMLIPEPRQLTLVLLIELVDDAISFIVRAIASRRVKKQALRQDCGSQIHRVGLWRRCSGSILGAGDVRWGGREIQTRQSSRRGGLIIDGHVLGTRHGNE